MADAASIRATQLSWSATLNVASQQPSGIPRGDKILLPQSALEGLLSANRNRTPSGFHAAYLLPDGVADGFRDQHDHEQLPQPLTFRLLNPRNGNTIYAGVREFSAPEGEVVLTPYLAEGLGLSPGSAPARDDARGGTRGSGRGNDADVPAFPIVVQAREPPKGRYVRLRPLEAGYVPDDWRALLEREFRRSFTVLTKGAVVAVQGQAGEAGDYRFLVDAVLPDGEAICVVDTDLEVDIEAMDEDQARETVRGLMRTRAGSGGSIDVWKPVRGEVGAGEYVDFVLSAWERSSTLRIELSGLEGDDDSPPPVELFVSPKTPRYRALPRDSAHVWGDFEPPSDGVGSIAILPTNSALEDAESIMISVHGAHGNSPPGRTARFTLRARSVRPDDSARGPAVAGGGTGAGSSSGPELSDEEQCPNCLRRVPGRTMVLHESFCRRNNVACTQCRRVFRRSSPQWEAHWHCPRDDSCGSTAESRARHDDVHHTSRRCACGFSADSLPSLAAHRTSVCPEKLILCRFCRLEVPQEGNPDNPASSSSSSSSSSSAALKGLTEHEFSEGSKTTECHLCGRVVRLFDMTAHLKLHEHEKAARFRPEICRNVNCGRTLFGTGPRGAIRPRPVPSSGASLQVGNGPSLCSRCFGPLHASIHDPDGKALVRRIERRYLSQLMVGCRRAWCGNEWCRTGRANRGLPETGKSTKDVLPLVRPLMQRMPAGDGVLCLCVDEESNLQRNVAEMVSAEGVWDVEWCVAAAEAERSRVDQVREWLRNWAPRRSGS